MTAPMVAALRRLWLGTHEPSWLTNPQLPPLCIARQRMLRPTASRGRGAVVDLMLDSGAFTELQRFGRWTLTPAEYVNQVRDIAATTGRLVRVAAQDWMCEDAVIHGGQFGPLHFVGTGLSRREHLERTVQNAVELRQLAPDLPWLWTVQGFTVAEYLLCLELYRSAGFDLTAEPVVGVGSVCRRQASQEIHDVFQELTAAGLRTHGFGVKTAGFRLYGKFLTDADSLAWSYWGRREGKPMPGCTRAHRTCQNCPDWALSWHGSRPWDVAA
jgi:hypothetical protein